jgi:hypothetical protein
VRHPSPQQLATAFASVMRFVPPRHRDTFADLFGSILVGAGAIPTDVAAARALWERSLEKRAAVPAVVDEVN